MASTKLIAAVFLTCVLSLISAERVIEMENEGVFEGDIVLTPEQKLAMKNGFNSAPNIWPNAIIPYDWEPALANHYGILNAFHEYHKYTCLRFVKRTSQRAHVYFRRGNGCLTGLGYSGGRVTCTLEKEGCDTQHVTVHEIGHAIGLYHEQMSVDRDHYIRIQWQNINPKFKYAFDKAPRSTSHGTYYDYKSVMHYGQFAYSINNKPTIITVNPYMQNVIGEAPTLSEIDIKQINRMYKCDRIPRRSPPRERTPTRGAQYKIMHSGYCLTVGAESKLVFSKNCNTRFTDVFGWTIDVFGHNKCVESGPIHSYLRNYCPKYEKYSRRGDGSFMIRKVGTNLCLIPFGGYAAEGRKLVHYQGCAASDTRYLFKLAV